VRELICQIHSLAAALLKYLPGNLFPRFIIVYPGSLFLKAFGEDIIPIYICTGTVIRPGLPQLPAGIIAPEIANGAIAVTESFHEEFILIVIGFQVKNFAVAYIAHPGLMLPEVCPAPGRRTYFRFEKRQMAAKGLPFKGANGCMHLQCIYTGGLGGKAGNKKPREQKESSFFHNTLVNMLP
jgi:hypothetical protein